MSLIADVCKLMTEQAYIAANNKLYALSCEAGDLGTTVLHHFRLSNSCPDSAEECCITDYVNQYILVTDSCTDTYSCANINITQLPPSEGDIIITQL